MTDTAIHATEQYIADLVFKWRDRLNLQGWRIRVIFDVIRDKRSADASPCATCLADPAYWTAKLTFDVPLMEAHGLMPEAIVIHEMLHIVFARNQNMITVLTEDRPGLESLAWTELEACVERMAQTLWRMEREGTDAGTGDGGTNATEEQ